MAIENINNNSYNCDSNNKTFENNSALETVQSKAIEANDFVGDKANVVKESANEAFTPEKKGQGPIEAGLATAGSKVDALKKSFEKTAQATNEDIQTKTREANKSTPRKDTIMLPRLLKKVEAVQRMATEAKDYIGDRANEVKDKINEINEATKKEGKDKGLLEKVQATAIEGKEFIRRDKHRQGKGKKRCSHLKKRAKVQLKQA